MTFLLLTFAIMSISILLIYKITNFFGFHVKAQALILCGIMAFFVNFVTLSLSAFLTQAHYIRIIAMVIVTAGLVTYYNERLLRKDRAKTAASDTQIAAAPQTAARAAAAIIAADRSAAPAAKKTLHPLPSFLQYARIQEVLLASIHTESTRLTKQTAACVTALPDILRKTIQDIVREDMENDQLLKLTAVIAKLGSLDDILDYAFEQSSRHNYSNAIFAYKRALDRYQKDDYAPFIVIELGNIYKENGAYDEAILAYRSAFSLPAVTGSDAMQAEFQKNIAYLRTVKYILTKHNTAKTPFNSIPDPYRREIEFTFQNRRTQKLYAKNTGGI